MGNTIWLKRAPELTLSMSNGLTSVFVSTFGLSGSRLAKSEQEKKLVVYVLEKNQAVFGIGMIDFDAGSLPWDTQNFEQDKQFILSVLDGIKKKLGWEKLKYEPNEEMLFTSVDEFEKMIQFMDKNDINIDEINRWLKAVQADNPINNGFPVCPVDGALLTQYGCQVCME
jgi:hypothetical protein